MRPISSQMDRAQWFSSEQRRDELDCPPQSLAAPHDVLLLSTSFRSICLMKPSEALTVHRNELRQLVSHYGLSSPRIFGSVVRGTDTEESDLDLLVDPGQSTSLLTLAGLKTDAEELLGVPVSVLTPNGLPPK